MGFSSCALDFLYLIKVQFEIKTLRVVGCLLQILGRLKIEFEKKFEWQRNFDADRPHFIQRSFYKKFSKNYPAVFEQMGG